MAHILSLVRPLIFLAVVLAPLASPGPAEAASLTVNTTDSTLDGRCDGTHCSLPDAVQTANLAAGPDTIAFNIPGAGPHVIRLRSGLTLTQPSTTIAGETEPDFTGQPVIVLDGRDLTGHGLSVVGDDSVVRGLSLIHFNGTGAAGIMVGGHRARIENCFLGIDPAGAAGGNSIGIKLGGENASLIGSYIAGNEIGILISHTPDVVVQRNHIGVNPAGDIIGNGTGIRLQRGTQGALIGGESRELGNTIVGSTLYGIHDASTPYGGNVIDSNLIGTTSFVAAGNGVGIYRFGEGGLPAAGVLTVRRNVIAANGTGLWLNGDDHLVEDNFIGIDTLEHPMPNTEAGVRLEGCAGCVVRGNVISGNPIGLVLRAGLGGEFDAVISHNRIGFNPGVNFAIPNGIGIQIEGGERTLIEGNAIGSNDFGIQLNAGDAIVRGNFIGTGFSGRGPGFPNGVGIRIGIGFSPSTIGGGREAYGNIIAFNTGDGIRSLANGQVIWHNQIYNNGGHGVHIDGGPASPTAAGLGDVISHNSIYDNGGLGISVESPELVGGLEPPELTAASATSLSGTATPNSLVEVFLADPDPTRHGEGKTYLGERSAGADGTFTITFGGAGTCPVYTATATDSHGNTSEFSLNRSTCLRLPPLVGIGILIGMAAGGSAFTLVIRRRPPDMRSAPGIALGALVGLGLGLLFLALPSVQLNWGGEDQGATAIPGEGNLPPPVTLTPVTITLTPAMAPEVMARENANCRQGPSTQFGVVTHLVQGQVVPITGRLAEGGWWQVQAPDLEAPCWIAESVAERNGDLDAVPVVVPPAPPTVPPTEEPASPPQGCWSRNNPTQACLYTAPCPANPILCQP